MSHSSENRRVIVEDTAEEATEYVEALLKSTICEAVDKRHTCCVALAGGTTPRALYEHLSQTATTDDVPWNKLEILFGDERDVPHDHVESNYGMVQRTLLDHLPIVPQRVHPMLADADDLDTAVAEYEQIIRSIVPAGEDGIPRLDLILLGMGGDGHTASLFPDAEALDENERLVAAYFVPVLGRKRMTITFPLINAARQVILLVTGQDKAEAVAAVLDEGSQVRSHLPASRIDPRDGVLMVVLDKAAASRAGL